MKSDTSSKFEKIYGEESDSIFRFCLTRVSSREQALDITQETFLRLWQNMQDEKDIHNLRAFLFTIAKNLIIDWYRKKKSISLESLTDSEGEVKFVPIDKKTIDGVIGAEGRFLVEKISELGEAYQDAVYLRFVEDLSPDEIGSILGISGNAASVRINRGLFELRKLTGYNEK